MIKQRFALFAALVALSLSAFAGHVSAQANASGKLRFVHALPGGPAVDVFVDNLLAARGLEYANATRYMNVKNGDHVVAVMPVGTGSKPSGTPILNAKVTVSADKPAQLVVIQGTADKPAAGIYDQDLGPLAPGNTRLTAVHAVSDGPTIDILRADDSSPLVQGLKYGDPYGSFDIPAAAPDVVIVPAGGKADGALLKAQGVPLVAGTHNTLIALGTASGNVKLSYLLLTAPTDANSVTDGLLRFVNAISGKAVDVYVDGKLIAPNLAFGTATEHIPFPTTTAEIEVRQAGDAASTQPLGTGQLSADGAIVKAQTVVIYQNAAGTLATQNYVDDTAKADPTKARLNIINQIGGTAAITLNGKAVEGGRQPGQASKSVEVSSGAYRFEAAIPDVNTSVKGVLALNGGTLTDLVLVGDQNASQLVVATTSLAEQPGSAPLSLNPDAVPVASSGNATAPAVAQNATEAPAATEPPATLVPTQPKPTTLPGIIGVVETNSNVNLKLREYPRTDARTLALVPSQSTVIVKGVRLPVNRTGTPAPVGTKQPTPTLVATSRADIWLFVAWQTPDGGTVTGWTLAVYLSLTKDGRPIRNDNVSELLAFPEIPETTPGEMTNTNVTPIALDTNRVMGTVQTNAGTNAQLRRTPGVDGESLALVPTGGTVTVISRTDVKLSGLVGEPKSPTWFFVQFDVEGSSVFGWMSADFLKLARRNKPVDVKDIPVATEITRGYITGQATAVLPPPKAGLIATVINVNNGANLQFRRDPNANAESLGLIPTGTELDVLGRNGGGSWLQVTYQANTGWVNAAFVKVTKAGKAVSIGDIKITNGDKDTFGTTTPTLTPAAAG